MDEKKFFFHFRSFGDLIFYVFWQNFFFTFCNLERQNTNLYLTDYTVQEKWNEEK